MPLRPRRRTSEVVVITGASAGVGRATAHRFARAGARVALIARASEALDSAAQEVRELGGQALAIPLDVADADAVEAAAERIESELGPIDVWVNAAMATIFAPVSEIRPAEFRRATEVTYLGTVHGTMAALKRMRSRNRGHVVQVGSALAYRAIPLQSAYCGAKFAIRGFTDALRVELMHERCAVGLTMVQLSAFNTPQFQWARTRLAWRPQPVPPIFQPEVAADAIYWAAHHRRRELWVGFPAVKAILGNALAPWLADRKLVKQGYSGQMSDQRLPEPRPDNLFKAVHDDYGTHGRFDHRARASSPQLWLTTHRPAVVAGALTMAALVARRLWGSRRQRGSMR
ncbi:SDR family oxidoreductase [Dyella sp.]|jgi:NADP-dependent 3-hydroxy acid dehydrogenase YdfG|uniref:SDR family oxidoreductase n=1 Tax=Dyella sp. TaxID=1869338 RepID=UPI002D77A213|nr:SDR family oxidoreductase [Dyella sp.]HET6433125.1 SDR family oxidoreductase [Dyella sp.]